MKYILSLILLWVGISVKAQVTVTYSYDNLNRLTQASYSNGVGIQYSYDALGNRTQETRTSTLSVEENENVFNIKIFPNPFKDELKISITENKLIKVTLMDIQGKTILEQDAKDTTHSLEVNELSVGTYILKVETDKGTQTFKVFKN